MATFRFDPQASSIRLTALVTGNIVRRLTLVLDTGASITTISREVALDLGLDPDRAERTTSFITPTAVEENVPLLTVSRVTALGLSSENLSIACKEFPLAFQIHADGLLGLNFLRNFKLFINFAKGVLVLQERNPRHLFHRISQIWELLSAHR